MPAFNFKKQFAPAVERGDKRQTIRKWARGACPGATAYLYTGQRTASCRKLGEGTITDVIPIEIGRHACGEPYAYMRDHGKHTSIVHSDLDALARDDGFQNGDEMVEWFASQYGLPFFGHLFKWVPK